METFETSELNDNSHIRISKVKEIKVECIFPVVISSEFRMRQHMAGDHQKYAHHFIKENY